MAIDLIDTEKLSKQANDLLAYFHEKEISAIEANLIMKFVADFLDRLVKIQAKEKEEKRP